ncbi:superoxide dismutase [Cu-Zn] [Elysia marginata]|uniref:Superoxide dismutase [Cu-Zn] n=1 Tax=Elysia marginata TaxID=1093978 RepID=A0AAV4J5N6_9GAST|nr:superoxide dismutase [Cu-Zn] [Elysia marginata]
MGIVGPINPPSEAWHRFILTLIDYATRYAEAVSLRKIDTETVAEALVDIYSRLGVPEDVLSDQGTQFMSDLTPMQEDIQQLQKTVESMANPINIHLDGVSSVDSSTLQQDVGKHKHHSHTVHEHGHDTHKQDHKHHQNHKHHEKEGAMKRGGKTTKCKNCKHHHWSKSTARGLRAMEGRRRRLRLPTNHTSTSTSTWQPPRVGIIGNMPAWQETKISPKMPGNLEVKVDARDTGRTDGRSLHGIHVHEFADVANGCNAFGGHYNPRGHDHGGPESEESRHPGDWGKIETKDGVVQTAFNASGTLFGPESMIGRGIVV